MPVVSAIGVSSFSTVSVKWTLKVPGSAGYYRWVGRTVTANLGVELFEIDFGLSLVVASEHGRRLG